MSAERNHARRQEHAPIEYEGPFRRKHDTPHWCKDACCDPDFHAYEECDDHDWHDRFEEEFAEAELQRRVAGPAVLDERGMHRS